MKVGLFFGSFNPVHIGHMAIANYIIEYSGIDRLWFVVSPQNPLKKKKSLANDYDRLEMVNLAIDNDIRFLACDIEFRLPKPSYTINTLTYLKEKHPSYSFVPIMGADNIVNLHKWKNFEILVRDYEFIVYPRPGFNVENMKISANYFMVEAPLMEISSTFIRKAVANNMDVRFFLPPKVYEYISNKHIYK
ncbi:MAG: nicotinate-nucleotide adenylyltransferase [Prolixibacteraceae bacterium]|nr:nicotinate-nucleotide adenylyltransferase [Prolixibacteraceae bacterium]